MARSTLLIVEDNELLRDGLREMLTYEGFVVRTARNGEDALECMKEQSPELIVSDITMPVMDGYDFYMAVRTKSEWMSIPFIFLTARADPEDIRASRNLGAEDYLTKPISREELVTTIRSRLRRSRQIQMAQLQQAYHASLTALANAIEERDPYSHGHVQRVVDCSIILAGYLGWHPRRIEHLRFGAVLHDIGKIHVPETILRKEGSLSPDEWALIKQHPLTGAEMIKGVTFLADVAPIVRHHHERWDGQGYPDGLMGEAIPEGARIVAVSDTLDAMITRRPYNQERNPEDAYDEILSLSEINYDPIVVKALQRAWNDGRFQEIGGRLKASR